MIGCQSMKMVLPELADEGLCGVAIKSHGNRVTSFAVILEPLQQKGQLGEMRDRERQADGDSSKGEAAGADNLLKISAVITVNREDMFWMHVQKKGSFAEIQQKIIQHVNGSAQAIQAHDAAFEEIGP